MKLKSILIILFSLVLFAGSADAQRKKAPKQDSSKLVNSAIARNDSLVAVEWDLPLLDSADDRPTFSLDGKMMVFGSRRPPMAGEKWRVSSPDPLQPWDGEIYYRLLTDTGWTIPINPGPPLNNSASQNNPTVHPRGDIIYFVGGAGVTVAQTKIVEEEIITQDTIFDKKGKVKKVNTKKDYKKNFAKPIPVPGEINNVYVAKGNASFNYQLQINQKIQQETPEERELFQRAPDARSVYQKEKLYKLVNTNGAAKFYRGFIRCENTVTPDGRYVVFSDNFGKTGEYGMSGEGDDDLWIAQINEKGGWDSVRAPNGQVNSAGAETYPFMAADGATLYFSSDKICKDCPVGASGGDDIYMSRLTDQGFSDPVILPPPFNSPYGDYGFSISPDGETAYFVSNRTGKSKFYQVKLRPQDTAIAPKPIIILAGKVTDKVTGKPVKAEIFVDELTEGKNSFSVFSDEVTGTYILSMQRGHRFGLQAVANGYMPRSERYNTPVTGSFDRKQLDLELTPIEVGSIAEFKNVYFDFNKSELLSESKLELDRVVGFLQKNKNATIEIGGHTDDVGNDEYNTKLSEDRAKSVMQYITSKGIPARRMTAKGYGKSTPIAKGNDDASRAKNRRVEMMITGNVQ